MESPSLLTASSPESIIIIDKYHHLNHKQHHQMNREFESEGIIAYGTTTVLITSLYLWLYSSSIRCCLAKFITKNQYFSFNLSSRVSFVTNSPSGVSIVTKSQIQLNYSSLISSNLRFQSGAWAAGDLCRLQFTKNLEKIRGKEVLAANTEEIVRVESSSVVQSQFVDTKMVSYPRIAVETQKNRFSTVISAALATTAAVSTSTPNVFSS